MARRDASTRRARARRGDGARLRREILDAAAGLLLERGDETAVSVRAVAERVGVSPPSIYLHFADKDELIFECSRTLIGRLQTEVFDQLAAASAIGRLREAAHAYVRFGSDNPEPYRIMFMSPRHVPADLVAEADEGLAAVRALRELVAAAFDEIPRDCDADHDLVSMGLWSALHGVTSLMVARTIEFSRADLRRLVDHVLDEQLHGLAVVEEGACA